MSRRGAVPAGSWRALQAIGVGATGLLLAGLFLRPFLALDLLWNAAIPVLPATFLVSPALWRNVCPLATLNMLPGERSRGEVLTADLAHGSAAAGVLLLAALVPARRFLFNTDGPALAVTVLAVAASASLLGLVFGRKGGFCNAFCPVLPVERLYGQRPLLAVGNPRCDPCSGCTARGCLDRSPARSLREALGSDRSPSGWLRTPFGAFAAAFPGFVTGYYTAVDVPLAAAGSVYLRVAVASAVSYGAVSLLVRGLRLPASVALPGLAALAVALYYWFTAPVVTEAWGMAGAVTWSIRAAALALVAAWLWRSPAGNGAGSPWASC